MEVENSKRLFQAQTFMRFFYWNRDTQIISRRLLLIFLSFIQVGCTKTSLNVQSIEKVQILEQVDTDVSNKQQTDVVVLTENTPSAPIEQMVVNNETQGITITYDQLESYVHDLSIGTTLNRFLNHLTNHTNIELDSNYYFVLDDSENEGFICIKILKGSVSKGVLIDEYFYDLTSGEIVH